MNRKFTIKVIPRASCNEVLVQSDGSLKVRLTAPPIDGAANEALRKVLAEHFNVKRSQIQIIQGEKARIKTIEINQQT